MAATPGQTTDTASLNVTAWNPGEDVIEVQRTPPPGAARSIWRTFAETARGVVMRKD